MNLAEVLAVFKEAGFSGKVYRSIEHITEDKDRKSIPCSGYERNIHPSACEWQREEQDRKCERCPAVRGQRA